MSCAQCQQDNPPGARFCNACGAPLEVACPRCGHSNAPGSRFCNECGQALTAAHAAAGPRFASPQSYTPPYLADKILTARATLEGERKQVTVLFADVKGSMELLADRDPEEARKLLDPVLEQMMEAVHHYEGTVNQVMGDGIMALFGAPLAHEDHAVRACYAALRMQESSRQYSRELRRSHGTEVQLRIGLNSGEVVVRTVGNDLRMDYSAVGQTTHLAARMEQLATPGSIRLTPDTLRLAEGFVQVASLGPVPVKGVAEPVEVFELNGAALARTRLQVAAARGLTRFVGRDLEIDQLRQALDRAREGHGQVVAVVGEPGVGKSRLFWELVHSHRTQDWLVLEGSSVSYGRATPYLPLVDLLRSYFKIETGDEVRRIREKVTGKVLTLDEALRPALPAFLALLEAPVEDPAGPAPDPSQRRQRTVDAVKRLLLMESRLQPVCLVLDDLHWIDAETQAVLDGLIDSLPTARLLLLVNYRPEYQHAWGSKTFYTQLRLDPLPAASAEALLESLLGADPELGALKRLLIGRTEGNPFFLEESVRTLVELRALGGERGAYRLTGPLESTQVPATVQAILASRIDRLPPEDKTLLQTAAIIGADVPFALLRAIVETPEEALRVSLTRLQAAEFLYEARLFPELEHTFKHALTHEVAYGSVLRDRRRALHALIVETFEALYPDRVTERLTWLAHHAFRGEVWGKALTYLRAHVTPSAEDAGLMGGPENPAYLWLTGEHDRALRAGQRDLAVAASFGNFAGTVVFNLRLGQIHHSLGDYGRALDFLQRSAAPLKDELRLERFDTAGLPSVFARAWLAFCLGELGELAEGAAHGEEGLEIAAAAAHSYSLIVACASLGTLYLVKGDLPRAIAVLERGLVLDQVESIPLLFPLVAAPLGSAYTLAGRVPEGVALLEQAVDQAPAMKFMANHPLRLARLGEAHLRGSAMEPAARIARQALDLAREQGERGHEAHALRLLGEITGHAPRIEEAQDCYRKALTLAESLGMRPLRAHCHLGLGTLYRRTGQLDAAGAELAAAADLFRSMEMTFWLPLTGPAAPDG